MGLFGKLFGRTAADPSLDNVVDASVDDIADEASQSTQLHLACSHGAVAEVQRLLGAGASVNVTNKWGATPLDLTYANADCAGRAAFVQIAGLLRARGAESRTWKGRTC